MLEKILTEKNCADCSLCCAFLESEIWEVPIIDDDFARLIEEKYDLNAEYEFTLPSARRFKASYSKDGLCRCPALSETGCKLGSDRPFDCKIWPFRAMKLGEFTVITVSPLCEKVNEKSIAELSEFLNSGLAGAIEERTKKYPEQVKDYVRDYVILKVISNL